MNDYVVVNGMKGYVFVTSSGYDPEVGLHIKDPYLGETPTFGACMPQIRRQVVEGDHIFLVSGKVKDFPQYLVGGFEVAKKLDALIAYHQFPEHRLRQREDGQLAGNVIVDAAGQQHQLDSHRNFERRIENYVVGRNPIVLATPDEIYRGRNETLTILRSVLGRHRSSPVKIIGRGGSRLDHEQVIEIRSWLSSIKGK